MNEQNSSKCLSCQLEKSDKVYFYFGWLNDLCDKHKPRIVPSKHQLDFIDDDIDLDAEQRLIDNDNEAQDIRDKQFWSGK